MIVVSNRSKHLSDAEVASMTLACDLQMQRHLAPAWGRIAEPVVFAPPGTVVARKARRLYVMDDPDEADLFGFHSETEKGRGFGHIFVDPILAAGGTALHDPQAPQRVTVASVLSHEVCELFIDPNVNIWVDGPEIPQGDNYALEVADPVEGDLYPVVVEDDTRVSVCNFVFPEWFDELPGARPRFDQKRTLKAPFTLFEEGYMVVRDNKGRERDVYGTRRPAWRHATKQHQHARARRRYAEGGGGEG